MVVSELRLPLVDHPASRSPMYPHQVAMWDAWDHHPTILLPARTGTGKTRGAMLPILKRREWAVAIYPTNELVKDQVRAVERFAAEEGLNALVWTPETWQASDRVERYSSADYILAPLDGALLDQWQQVMHCKSRGETLRRVLDPGKPKIIFTNPDILFLILGLRYHAEPFEALRRYDTLVIDEFHAYQGVELAHALVMVALARGFGIFRRVVLLSATPHPEVKDLLDRAVGPMVIGSALQSDQDAAEEVNLAADGRERTGWRTAVHEVEVTPVQLTAADPVELLLGEIVRLRPALERLRAGSPDGGYLPAVVIVNSVLNAIRLEDRLVECGFARDSLAVIRGLSNRAIRDTKGKLLALGTSAIEVGVDFHCDYLLFEALEASSFLQRFGRVGRDRPGKAIVLVPPNAFQGMSSLPTRIDRAAFEERIRAWYPSALTRPWFVTTDDGMITARALGENLIATVAKDGQARPEVLVQLRDRVEEILSDHAARLRCPAQNLQAQVAFQRCAAGKSVWHWLDTYRKLNRFRTSLPSVKVHDFREHSRRQDWQLGDYEIDLATLLRRAASISWNEKLGMLVINGIGKYRRVHASEIFSDQNCGIFLETQNFPHMLLYQDGEYTPVSDLMGRESHIFTVAPRADIGDEIDWRLPVFESGEYLLAFDGAALLLHALWKRKIEGPMASKRPNGGRSGDSDTPQPA
jgi:CRISPR-associated endonuclease/helicase Cas3